MLPHWTEKFGYEVWINAGCTGKSNGLTLHAENGQNPCENGYGEYAVVFMVLLKYCVVGNLKTHNVTASQK